MRRPASRANNASGAPPGRLRIVAGKWRGRRLPVADEPGLRPTSERIRETLFNWLAATLEGARCLDLFAGSGALGFEALSRGAGRVVFVESSARAVEALKDSASLLEASGAEIVRGDALQFLQGEPQRFDVVFLDPPFATDRLTDLCRLLDEADWLADGARVYLEQDRHRPLPTMPAGWTISRDKTAGRVRYALAATSN